ncbi:DM13 domain-containing protein [Shewanella donghaensis]|uniref:DM13 domain-containing protein n=1 Tax=Shewanella donghaensis TaxID=238836 RepID=UPI001181F47F|nr:DM13 domain-containing protein [Shewanella donghaensis]
MSTKHNNKPLITIFCATSLLFLVGCGGSSDDSSNSDITSDTATPSTPAVPTTPATPTPESPTILTGLFLDSAVSGLNYQTASQQGVTNLAGEFSYLADENITFSIGQTVFPALNADAYITPLSVFNTTDINATEVVNTLRLLQSLDSDRDVTNGIVLPSDIHTLVTNNIDFRANNFESLWLEVIQSSQLTNKTFVTADDAIYHFQQTLMTIDDGSASTCTKTHAKIGWTGMFETFAHNVSGKATIVDDCTIVIEQFDYDGLGPDVYFYGAIANDYVGSSAFSMGNKLNGQSYANAQLTIKLPKSMTMDDLTGMSVWCVDFNANFGQVTFTQ